MEMRIDRQREVDRKGREREHKQENEKRLKNIQRFFFWFDTWLWGVRSKWRKLGQRRAKRAEESLSPSYGLPCVAQLTSWDYADAARGSVLSTSLWGQTKMGERERGFFDAVYPSLPRPTHSLRLRFLPPLINHLCVWVCLKLLIHTYSNGLDIKRAAEVLSCVCVCVCMRRIQGHNIQARCISQTRRDVIL